MTVPPTSPNSAPTTTSDERHGNGTLCGYLGVICLLIGAYFLFLAPGNDTSSTLDPGVVNLQSLFIGATLWLTGAIFLAVVMRPRT